MVVKYSVSLTGRHRPGIGHSIYHSLLRDVEFHFANKDFVSFLLTDDVTNLPFVGWPRRKDGGPFMWFGGYEWIWQENIEHLIVSCDLQSLTFSYQEARRLGSLIAADYCEPVKPGRS
jgi:hypothetical protein